MNNRNSLKRVLKPVIEKKRRDRINQRLDELRTILLSNTSDMRLKNPKLEKAEILELTVDYIRRNANGNDRKALSESHVKESSAPVTSAVSSKRTGLIHEHTQPPPNPIYSAGFRECISRLGNYIDSVDPSQRESFVQELRDHLDAHSACPLGRVHSQTFPLDLQPWGSGAEGQCLLGRVQNRKESTGMGHQRAIREATFPYINTSLHIYPNTFVLHHPHPTQHLSHPYPSPPYSLSPPPSPSYSSSSTPIAITSPYLSMPCHFPFSPSPSEHRSDSLSSSSHSTSPLVAPLVPDHTPLGSSIPTPLCPSGPVPDGPTRTLGQSLFQIQPQAIWRPWP
uniref:transcription factor HES-7-like isoform X1 n=2 Tax=Oncorhynchus gorbuscha TaxID=8017 RepID=UPI001EAEDCC1|nr:transcription factor HES-7-like isoform X1 [Oncorhynchus gorbuscha]